MSVKTLPRAQWRTSLRTLFASLLTCGSLLAASPAQAGTYTVSYSGGQGTLTQDESTQIQPYGNANSYGTGGTVSWGEKLLPDNTYVPTSGDAHCEGDITATFTWEPSDSSDEPPDKVVIAETSRATYYSSGNLGAFPTTKNADNGLGFSTVVGSIAPPNAPFFAIYGMSSGTRYQIKDDPGASFSITCSPSVQVAGTGSHNNSASGSIAVGYTATASPLEVTLFGGIGPQHHKRYLIGQLVTATVADGGLPASSFDW